MKTITNLVNYVTSKKRKGMVSTTIDMSDGLVIQNDVKEKKTEISGKMKITVEWDLSVE